VSTIPSNVFGALALQYSTDLGVTWTTFGIGHSLGALIETRRFALAPGQSVTAQHWRIIATQGAHLPGPQDWDTAVMRCDAIGFWAEALTLADDAAADVELMAFNYDDQTQRYILPVTEFNVDVWNLGTWQSAIVAPWDGAQAVALGRTQMLDTMLCFNQQVQPQRIMRQGAAMEWDSRAIPFDNLPLYDYTGKKLGGVNAVQELFFIDYAGGDTFNITLEGQTTQAIAWNAVTATLAASIQSALEALPGVGAGNVVAADGGGGAVVVTFQGKLAASDVSTMAPVTLHSTAGGVSVANITTGKAGGEPIISGSRGWPGTGTFYQQRLFLAGLAGRPETFLGSQIGAYFSFDTAGATEAGALNENLDTADVTAVTSIFCGRNLQIFTNSAEFYFPMEPITPPAPVVQATRRGSEPTIPPVMMDRSTIFVGPGGDSLYDYMFQYFHNNYESTCISVLASHIVRGVIDLGFRKHTSTTDCDMAVMPRNTGDAVVMVALRDQDITGFVPWTTTGSFLAAVGDLGGDLYVATLRTLGDGSPRRFLERVDPTCLMDCSIATTADDARIVVTPGVDGGADTAVWTGSAHLEGLTVSLYIDGSDAGDAIASASIPLPTVPKNTLEVGLNFQPTGLTLPFVFQNDPRAGASMRPTVGEIAFRLGPTSNLMAGLAGGKLWRVPLKTRSAGVGGDAAFLDQGPGQNAFTGWTRLKFVPGFRQDAQITFTQTRPGPLSIEEIVATASS
jgi:hypothetical protein